MNHDCAGVGLPAGVALRDLVLEKEGVWLKPDSLQPVGAFKMRGAYFRLSTLTDAERSAGVIHAGQNRPVAGAGPWCGATSGRRLTGRQVLIWRAACSAKRSQSTATRIIAALAPSSLSCSAMVRTSSARCRQYPGFLRSACKK